MFALLFCVNEALTGRFKKTVSLVLLNLGALFKIQKKKISKTK
jgi:hypothetical protein